MTNKELNIDSPTTTDDIEAGINLGFITIMSKEDLDTIFNEVFKHCEIIDLESFKGTD